MNENMEWRLAGVEGTCAEILEWRDAEIQADRLPTFEKQIQKIEERLKVIEYSIGLVGKEVVSTSDWRFWQTVSPEEASPLLTAAPIDNETRTSTHDSAFGWMYNTCIGRDSSRTVEQIGVKGTAQDAQPATASNELELRDQFVYSLEESVWDVSLLIGVQGIGINGSILAVVLLLTNIAMQCTLALIVWEAFTENPLSEESLDSLWKWRLTRGHAMQYSDPLLVTSLVSRVCAVDRSLTIASYQTDLIKSFDDYKSDFLFSGVGIGSVLCMFVQIMWVITVMAEFRHATEFLNVVVNMPHRDGTVIEFVGERIHIRAIGWPRLAAILCITMIRLIVGACLLFAGSLWLAYEMSISDLILNALALSFVFDLDELLFRTFKPPQQAQFLERMEPLSTSLSQTPLFFRQIRLYTTWCSYFAALAWVGAVAYFVLLPQQRKMSVAWRNVCGGHTTFVYAAHSSSGRLFMTDVQAYENSSLSPMVAAREELLEEWTKANTREGRTKLYTWENERRFLWFEDLPEMSESFNLHPSLAMRAHVTDCVDFIPPDVAGLVSEFGSSEVNTCEDVHRDPSVCDLSPYAKLYCPITCGCASPFSGVYPRGEATGCPTTQCQNTSIWTEALANTSCHDFTASVLTTSPGWQRYANGMIAALALVSSDGLEKLKDSILTLGCDSLPLIADWYMDDESGRVLSFFCTTVAAFCPVTCKCKEGLTDSAYCPHSCLKAFAAKPYVGTAHPCPGHSSAACRRYNKQGVPIPDEMCCTLPGNGLCAPGYNYTQLGLCSATGWNQPDGNGYFMGAVDSCCQPLPKTNITSTPTDYRLRQQSRLVGSRWKQHAYWDVGQLAKDLTTAV